MLREFIVQLFHLPWPGILNVAQTESVVIEGTGSRTACRAGQDVRCRTFCSKWRTGAN